MSEDDAFRENIIEWYAQVSLLRIIVASLLRRKMSPNERRDFVERLQVPSHGVIQFEGLPDSFGHAFERAKEDLIVEILRERGSSSSS